MSTITLSGGEGDERDLLIDRKNGYKRKTYVETTPINQSNVSATNGIVSSHGRRDDNGHGPPSCVTIVTDRITYTWHEMNVFTVGAERRRRRRWEWPWRRSEVGVELRKHIVKNVSGVAHPGELLAIMGSSGAGKTTLLNTLMFRSPASVVVTGQRAMNGIPVASSALASLSAYVQQDDLFIGTLTVREHLTFHALVRMDREIPYAQRMRRVDQVIVELGLSTCQNNTIGVPGKLRGISGGEMKRLSFATEVLTDPPLMFCDEPTSGLDSFMAQNVVSVMKSMALKGKTVVTTIHQPSSEVFDMFDKVLLMAEGRVAFLGSKQDASDFFKQLGVPCPTNYNPADFFIQLLAVVPNREESCRETIEMVCDTFDRSEAGINLASQAELWPEIQDKTALPENGFRCKNNYFKQDVDPKRRSPYKASWLAQFRALVWRSWLSNIKNPLLIKFRILQTIMIAVMIGLLFYGQVYTEIGVLNMNGVLFFFVCQMVYQYLFAVIHVFCAELPVFMREHLKGTYRVDVYFLCKTVVEMPIFTALPIIFTSISYYMVGLNPEFSRFLVAICVTALLANVSTSFGYLLSCAAANVATAVTLAPTIATVFFVFGGFLLNNGSVPAYYKWLSALSWYKYGYEALLINQWEGVDNITCTNFNSTCPKSGHVILEALNFSESDLTMDIASLCGLIVGFRVLAYLALLWRTMRAEN